MGSGLQAGKRAGQSQWIEQMLKQMLRFTVTSGKNGHGSPTQMWYLKVVLLQSSQPKTQGDSCWPAAKPSQQPKASFLLATHRTYQKEVAPDDSRPAGRVIPEFDDVIQTW